MNSSSSLLSGRSNNSVDNNKIRLSSSDFFRSCKSCTKANVLNDILSNMEDNTKKQERQLMRPWLIDQVEKGDILGLKWYDRDERLIKISWTHAASHRWNKEHDSQIFKLWAQHTGRCESTTPKTWKANFRCALNSLPDVEYVRNLSQTKGYDAYKIYRLLEEKRKETKRPKKNNGEDKHSKKCMTHDIRLLKFREKKKSIKQERNILMYNRRSSESGNSSYSSEMESEEDNEPTAAQPSVANFSNQLHMNGLVITESRENEEEKNCVEMTEDRNEEIICPGSPLLDNIVECVSQLESLSSSLAIPGQCYGEEDEQPINYSMSAINKSEVISPETDQIIQQEISFQDF